MTPQLQLDLPHFLKRHWQKRPLLIRGALPAFQSPLDGDDLAALAADERALARLIRFDAASRRWSLQHGPFAAADYDAMGTTDWTLLVQDVDKWLPEVMAPLLAQFQFLPSWRIEDVMVSFAVPGGSVGAHVDQYDVFLLQAAGRRRWLIDDRKHCPLELDARAPLRLLKQFTPTQDWILEPGDMLYLPPGVPHHGIAVDQCLTYSIGLRAPAAGELLQAVAAELALQAGEGGRYRDPPLRLPPAQPGQIDARAIKRVRRTLKQALKNMDDARLAACFGRFMSGYRTPRPAQMRSRAPSLPAIAQRLTAGSMLCADPWQRLNWTSLDDTTALLHGAGSSVSVPVAAAVRLCDGAGVDASAWDALETTSRRGLQQLLTAGALQLRRP